ncbi:putative ribonuclease H-like domain-containing protein [Tanacetum coccineum]
MNRTVFKCTEEDFLNKPLYSRFSKTDNFKGVPHLLSGDYTPKPQEEIDDSLYFYGKKGPQKPEISDSDDNSTERSTCQSNDSEGSYGNTSEHSSESESKSISVTNEMSTSKYVITNEKVVSESKEVERSCAKHVKTRRQQMKNQGTSEVKGKNWNKMMERELGEVWTNANRVNHAIHFVPRPVQLNAVRQNVNSVRHNVNSVRTNVNTGRSKQPVPTCNSNSFSPVRPQGNWGTAVKTSAGYNWRNSRPNSNCDSGPTFIRTDHPLKNMEDRGIFDSGCSGHMTGNKDHLDDFEEYKGGSVTFGGSKGYITGKGRIRVGNLDFDSVSFVKELGHFNLFSISQICDKQHKVLFTETECLVVSPDFKMPDENQILLKVPRQHNMYSFDMKTPSLTKDYACLIAKATSDESKLWHRRLGHINFKNLNKLVKGNLVRGLPSKVFKNDHTCVACQKGKQHKASCKAKLERTITEPLHTLHMDLFGPTSVKSINHASYCLVITDDCTRFSWVFFLATKDETSGILQNFIRQIENQLNHRVKIIRSDNGTEFKNRDMLEFCGNKGIKQEYSNARTPQQNGVAERMNRTLIEAARTMLADSLLPTTFWAEAVSTACYIFNRLLQKLQNLQTQEKEAFSIGISEDTLEILAFRRDLDQLAQKHLREVTTDQSVLVSNSVKFVEEPKKIYKALKDDSWVEAMQEELLQFRLQQILITKKVITGAWEQKVYHDKHFIINKDRERIHVLQVNENEIILALQEKSRSMIGKPNLGLWYPRESSFDLEAFSDNDYAGANLDRKSITGGCQFLRSRLISWQCKKQTIVATSTTEAEYVVAASCCEQVLWIQNQMLDYGFNFMNTKIYIDNESTTCIVKNPIATPSTLVDGTLELRATIDTLEYTITEASVRSKLQLADALGISMLPNTEIFEGMGNMGYPTDGSFTFWKSFFTPQWRFFVHHILHCISPKSGGWDQFSSNIATALICLSTGRVYNFSKLIFDGMVANLKSKTKFLMYPRFLQMILELQCNTLNSARSAEGSNGVTS